MTIDFFRFLTFLWDPSREIFIIPGVRHPITWYGLLFACGFIVGYFLIRRLFSVHLMQQGVPHLRAKLEGITLADRLTLLVVLGTVIGARIGHVFFYEWDYYSRHLLSIIKVWEGGLASHGGAIGILIALGIFRLWSRKQYPTLTFLAVLDAIMIPAAFVAGCIRIGNFINQEILGKPTTLPWGVHFLHPLQEAPPSPLHPVQLYEALTYFAIFSLLLFIWKKRSCKLGEGILSGIFFLLVFGSRFLIEFLKLPQTASDATSFLNVGQRLSLPFIVLGIILLWRGLRRRG